MSRLARCTVLVVWTWLLLVGVCFGKQLYLADGGTIDCKSFRQRGDLIVVNVNRDTVIEFERREVDLRRTLLQDGKKVRHKVRQKPAAKVTQPVAAKAATAAAAAPLPVKTPTATAAPVAKAAAVKPLPPAAVAAVAKPVPPPVPVTKPAPAPVAAPAAKEPLQTAEAAKTAAEASAPPDKAETERRSKQAVAMMTEAIQKNDPELMKKALALQRGTVSPESQQKAGILGLKFMLIMLICSLLIVVSMWVVFTKAGESGWKSLVPFYNLYILLLISGKPGWWFLLLLIPLVGVVFFLLAMLALAERFDRGALFGIGLAFLPMFFFPMLAFGGAQIEEFEFVEM